MPIVIVAVPLAASTSNLPGSETTVFSLSSYASTLYGFITLSDKQSISTLESESVAAVAMLNNALAGRNRSASDVVVSYPTEIQILLKRSKISLCRSTICMYTIIDTNTSLELKIT